MISLKRGGIAKHPGAKKQKHKNKMNLVTRQKKDPGLSSAHRRRRITMKTGSQVKSQDKKEVGQLWNFRFLNQSNDNANCVPKDDIFNFIDDLTTLEIINFLFVGLTSFHLKHHLPSNIGTQQKYTPAIPQTEHETKPLRET